IQSTSKKGDFVMDFFLGSGTTTAVAQKLKRKWLGVEMGEHFWTTILPRMKRVLFYDKSGISNQNDVKETYKENEAGGFFKYHVLEQHEDALENIEFEEQPKMIKDFFDYFVKYFLEWETKKSKTFLNIDGLEDPFNYKLKIIKDYRQMSVNIDLIETFNYLLGLNVKSYNVLESDGRRYVLIFGEKDGRRIGIAWRNVKDIDHENDKKLLENEFRYFNPDEIYANRDAVIKNFKPIDTIFKQGMFEMV
ncbi:MAG: DNA methyltransferase, partial [Candidatus Helarchaeales archaeon]